MTTVIRLLCKTGYVSCILLAILEAIALTACFPSFGTGGSSKATPTPHPINLTIEAQISQAQPLEQVARLGRGPVGDAAFSPDGRMVAVASTLGVWLYETDNQDPPRLLEGHAKGASTVVWSPDGSMLASGGAWNDRTVQVWDVSSGQQLQVLEAPAQLIRGLSWSPDGTKLAAGLATGGDNTVWIWDVGTGETLQVLRGHTDNVTITAWSPDGTRLASADYDGRLRVWDTSNGRKQYEFRHADVVVNLAWSPDGQMIAEATGTQEGKVRVWDMSGGRERYAFAGYKGNRLQTRIAWSPDGRLLATAAESGLVKVWDIANTGSLQLQGAHKQRVNAIAWSPDGGKLASGDSQGTIRVWDLSSGQTIRTLTDFPSEVNRISWLPDDTLLAFGSKWREGAWVSRSAGERSSLLALKGFASRIGSVAWSPDGTQIAATTASTVQIWEPAGEHLRHQLDLGGDVTDAAWSPDGRQLATAGGRVWLTAEGSATGEDLRLWDTTSWKKLAGYRYAKSVAWSPDSSFVAVSGYKTLFIWDVAKKQIVLTLSGYTDDVRGVAWSPDGKWLTSVGKNEKVVRIWDVTTGQTVHELNWEEMLSSVAWSPDGKSLAAGGRESIPIWDVSSSQLQAVLKGQAGGVNSLAWSPNGRWLAAASSFNEPMVRVWDVNSQALAYVLTGHTDDVKSVAWSPDGKRLATGSKDGTVRVWAMH